MTIAYRVHLSLLIIDSKNVSATNAGAKPFLESMLFVDYIDSCFTTTILYKVSIGSKMAWRRMVTSLFLKQCRPRLVNTKCRAV